MATNKHLVDPRRPLYQSFLLKVWRRSEHDPWRASLHSTATDQACHFDTLDELVGCLKEQLGEYTSADAVLLDHRIMPDDTPKP